MSTHEHKDTVMVTSARNRKIGLFLLIGPWVGLVLILTSWAITSFVISRLISATPTPEVVGAGTTALASGDVRQTAARIINVALGFFGILCVVGIIVGIPLGILFLRKREPSDSSKYDSRSGHGDASVAPEEVSGWNWGAFGLPVLWGIYYNVWVALLCFIPILGIPVSIYLGIKGNELAWKRNKWTSVEDFKKAQKKWMIWGILGFIFGVLVTISRLAGVASDTAIQTSNNDTVSGYQKSVTNQLDQPSAPMPVKQLKTFTFTSSEDGFKAIFPNQPSREEESSDTGTVGTAKTTTYTSQKEGANYYIFVYTYFNERMNEDNPNFSAVGAMEGAINGMANQDGARLVSSKKAIVDGKEAYRYEIRVQDESMEGLIVYKGNRMYNIAVNYLTSNGAPSDTENYLESLELLD